MRRMTRVYMLVGDGWVYPGRHVDPNKRYQEHLDGKVLTTAPRIAVDLSPPIMVPMEEYDFDLDAAPSPHGEAQLYLDMRAGKHVPEGHDILCAIYPSYSKEGIAKSVEVQRKRGFPNLAKALEVQRRNKGGVYNPEQWARGHETRRKNKLGVFDPAHQANAFVKSLEARRKRGFPELVKANHVQHHVNKDAFSYRCSLCWEHVAA